MSSSKVTVCFGADKSAFNRLVEKFGQEPSIKKVVSNGEQFSILYVDNIYIYYYVYVHKLKP